MPQPEKPVFPGRAAGVGAAAFASKFLSSLSFRIGNVKMHGREKPGQAVLRE